MRNQILIASGIGAAALFAGSMYFYSKTGEKQARAARFRKALRELLVAGAIGGLGKSAFNPNFLSDLKNQGKGPIPIIGKEKAFVYAKQIKDALNWWNEVDKVQGVFEKLDTKVKVSQVADAFLTEYKTGLLPFLLEELSESEFKSIKEKVRNLKDY